MGIELRPATPADVGELTRVFLGCWRQSYAAVLPLPVIETMTDTRATQLWEQSLARPGRRTTVAVQDGEVIGFIGYANENGEGWVHSLYVDPNTQNTGAGRALLEHGWRTLTAEGVGVVRLWVFENNAAGRAFYERCGWFPDGETRIEPEYGPLELRCARWLAEKSLAAIAADHVLATPGGPPGCVVGVLAASGEHLTAAAGAADTSGSPMSVDLHFDVASVTKVIATTQCCRALVSAGELRLDALVGHYLPESGPAAAATVADLLMHRAGLWEWQPLYLSASDPWQALASLPLRYPMHSARYYSDLGFMLLGRVIEQVTGSPLRKAVADLVTTPFAMTGTGFGPVRQPCAQSSVGDAVERSMVATGDPYPIVLADLEAQFDWRTTPILAEANDGNCYHAFGGVSGHAGLFSNVTDLLAFVAKISQVNDEWFQDGPDAGQALGWRSTQLPLSGEHPRFLYHTGFTGQAVGFWPGSSQGVVLLTNRLLAAGDPVPTAQLLGKVLAVMVGDAAVNASGLLEHG